MKAAQPICIAFSNADVSKSEVLISSNAIGVTGGNEGIITIPRFAGDWGVYRIVFFDKGLSVNAIVWFWVNSNKISHTKYAIINPAKGFSLTLDDASTYLICYAGIDADNIKNICFSAVISRSSSNTKGGILNIKSEIPQSTLSLEENVLKCTTTVWVRIYVIKLWNSKRALIYLYSTSSGRDAYLKYKVDGRCSVLVVANDSGGSVSCFIVGVSVSRACSITWLVNTNPNVKVTYENNIVTISGISTWFSASMISTRDIEIMK